MVEPFVCSTTPRARPTFRRAAAAALLTLAAAAAHAAHAAPCDRGDTAAAAANAASLDRLAFTPFPGQPETGWRAYAPLTAAELRTDCAPHTPGFAAALARWQSAHRLPGSGLFDPATWTALYARMQAARPFIRVRRTGPSCPPAADPAQLTALPATETYGRPQHLVPGALAAWTRLRRAAAREPWMRADPRLLTVFSAHRSPDYQAALCARDGNCDGRRRATCSAHRTGYALDVYLGTTPGYPIDSTAPANRRALAAGPAYRWLAANARAHGFTPYAYEPWHWEWTETAL